MRLLALLAVAAVILSGCSEPTETLPYYLSADLTPEWLTSAAGSEVHKIPPFALRNQENEVVTEPDIDGHIVVASFFFTSCSQVCPILKSRLARIQEAYIEDDRVVLLSHSVAPMADSVAALARYAATNDIQTGRWHLLTGAVEDIDALARNGYFVDVEGAPGDLDGYNLLHTETVVLLDGKRRIRGVYTGTLQLEVERILEDMAVLLAERQ